MFHFSRAVSCFESDILFALRLHTCNVLKNRQCYVLIFMFEHIIHINIFHTVLCMKAYA